MTVGRLGARDTSHRPCRVASTSTAEFRVRWLWSLFFFFHDRPHTSPTQRDPCTSRPVRAVPALNCSYSSGSSAPPSPRHRQLLRLITFKLKLLDIFRHGHPVWPIELCRGATPCSHGLTGPRRRDRTTVQVGACCLNLSHYAQHLVTQPRSGVCSLVMPPPGCCSILYTLQ